MAKLGTALVTGASSGIGAVYADRLAKRGYDLILVGRDRVRLDALAERLRRESGVAAEALPADLTARAGLALVEDRLRNDATITMLVNNAGIAVAGAVIGGDADRLEEMVQINITAATRLAVAALPGFVARRQGTLINIASVLALMPELFNGVYAGSKAYILALTQSLQQEVLKLEVPVRIQAVLPGATRTEIWQRAGTPVDSLPPSIVMGVDEMVEASLAGLDLGEPVTFPAMPELSDWQAFETARAKLAPNLSRDHAAARYLAPVARPG